MIDDSQTDEDLMAVLGLAQIEALVPLVHRYQHKALSTAYRMLGRRDLAEDVTQEAFLRVNKAAPNYEPRAKFSTWFYRIVVNLCLDEQRRNKRQLEACRDFLEQVPSPSKEDNPIDIQEAHEKQRAVREALGKLNERERTVVVLQRYEGLSYREMAEVTGWSESAIDSLLVRAYRKLRQELKKFEKL